MHLQESLRYRTPFRFSPSRSLLWFARARLEKLLVIDVAGDPSAGEHVRLRFPFPPRIQQSRNEKTIGTPALNRAAPRSYGGAEERKALRGPSDTRSAPGRT